MRFTLDKSVLGVVQPSEVVTGSLVGVVGTECRGQRESLVIVAAGVNEPVRVFVDDAESVE
jgi:hypothetical protein